MGCVSHDLLVLCAMCLNAAGRAGYFARFLKAPAHTAYPAHYLSSKSGLLKKAPAHTAYPTHYLSPTSPGFLKKLRPIPPTPPTT